jgi:hypothetical protein
MMKYLSFCLVMTMFCFSYPSMGQEVEISIDHPSQVNAGQEFTVTVTIKKGSLTDYSRFSQDLPLGLSAINVSSPNADFSFDNQRIRIIWLKLPESNEVKVTYNILVNERLKGSFLLGGVFAYVVEDERKFLNFEQSKEINIIPNPSVDPALIVDIKNFKGDSEAIPTTVEPKQEVFAMAIRQKPILERTGGYLVHLLINNPTGSKYAKIEETIPSGYIFEEVSSHDGIVSHAAATAKFIWMKLPESSEFEVVYRLLPKQAEKQGDMVIEGLLTYTSGNENILVEVKEMDVSLQDLTAAEKRNLLLTGTIPVGARTSTETAQKPPEKTVVPEFTETKPPPPPTESKSEPAGATGNTIVNTRVLDAGSGVYFRVQVTANRNPFDARSFYRTEGVDEEVLVERHQGLYKYTTGSFKSYDQALAYRNRVERISSISGSFVVAYRDGKRVPLSSVRR